MFSKLKEKFKESIASVLPISIIVLILSIVVDIPTGTLVLFLAGALLLIIGMGFFQLGAEMAMTPLGRNIGTKIIKTRKIWIIVAVCLVMGIIITIAEPDLLVLANQVPSIPNDVLIYTIAIGVGIFLVLAFLRIYFEISLPIILTILYVIVFTVAHFAPVGFIPVAFDSGGVTTGPMTVPFIMTLGVGLCAVRSDKESANDSFGFIALCSVGPILMVLLLGMFYNPSGVTPNESGEVFITHTLEVVGEFAKHLPEYAYEVCMSIIPIVAVFLLFQLIARLFRKRQLLRISVGLFYTFIGLVLFLTGVNVGFAPVGTLFGEYLGASSLSWLLIPVGALVGYFIVKAEPAVQVLNNQVDQITGGLISSKTMNLALSIGVSGAVVLSMCRVLTGLDLYYIIIPGYIVALALSYFVPPVFVGIAFDSGGVASGPMTSTFLLPLAIGACKGVGGNVVTDAFGAVALVALSPLLTIQLMGLIFKIKSKVKAPVTDEITDEIIEFEEDM